jgi:hypothetical protein
MANSGNGVMIATDTGMTVVRSAMGCSSEKVRRKMEIPVFWIPVSTAMAIASGFDCLKIFDAIQPNV